MTLSKFLDGVPLEVYRHFGVSPLTLSENDRNKLKDIARIDIKEIRSIDARLGGGYDKVWNYIRMK